MQGMKNFMITTMLTLLATVVTAQEAANPATEPAGTPNPDASEAQVDSKEPADIAVVEDSSRNPPPPSSRFEPSEQISEDLSVSFPIDI
jgi:hypothetical protein